MPRARRNSKRTGTVGSRTASFFSFYTSFRSYPLGDRVTFTIRLLSPPPAAQGKPWSAETKVMRQVSTSERRPAVLVFDVAQSLVDRAAWLLLLLLLLLLLICLLSNPVGSNLVWSGVLWCGLIWCRLVWSGILWSNLV